MTRYGEWLGPLTGIEAPEVTEGTSLANTPLAESTDAGVRLPVAEAAASEVLSLPIWPEIEEATQERVVEALSRALKSA
jgi:dTDP-4-amino-4,6-dideoxygalactose transaminase